MPGVPGNLPLDTAFTLLGIQNLYHGILPVCFVTDARILPLFCNPA
jgi:hypothetical protein